MVMVGVTVLDPQGERLDKPGEVPGESRYSFRLGDSGDCLRDRTPMSGELGRTEGIPARVPIPG